MSLEEILSKLLKCYTKNVFLKKHLYNFKSFKLILKVYFEDTLFIILEILNLS